MGLLLRTELIIAIVLLLSTTTVALSVGIEGLKGSKGLTIATTALSLIIVALIILGLANETIAASFGYAAGLTLAAILTVGIAGWAFILGPGQPKRRSR